MEYKFRQELSREDYQTFVMNHLKNGLLRPFNIILFMFSMGYLLSSPFMPGNEGNWTFFFVAIGLLLVLILMVVISKRRALKNYDKVVEEFKVNFTVSEEKIIYQLDDGRLLEKTWAEFALVRERKDFLYLFINKQSAIVIVTRDLDPQIVRFIKEQLEKNLDDRQLKFPRTNETTY